MTKNEKIEIAGKLSADELLRSYDFYTSSFNPINPDFIETYEIIRAEMLRRMENRKGGSCCE